MSAATPVLVTSDARLVEWSELADPTPTPTSWFITHGMNRPAAGTYTEVAFVPSTVGALGVHLTGPEVVRVLDQLVRDIAGQLYGTAWAFIYPPHEFDDAIGRFGLRRRELVLVTSITVHP